MNLIKKIWLSLLLLSCMNVNAQVKTFSFPTTKFSYVSAGSAVPSQSKSAVIEVNILDNGNRCIVNEGKYKLMDIEGANWCLNSMGALQIKKGDDFFLVHRGKGVINVGHDGGVMMFTDPVSLGKFNVQYDALFMYLNELKKIKADGAKSKAKTKSAGSATDKTATSGELKPSVFAYHPFGVVSADCTTLPLMRKELAKLQFPCYVYNKTLLKYGSEAASLLPPFTMFGKKVTGMSAYFGDTLKLTNYSLDLQDLKKNWTQNDVIATARKIVNQLKANGFNDTDNTTFKTHHFYYKDLRKGTRRVIVKACQSSRTATMDAYSIEIDVRP